MVQFAEKINYCPKCKGRDFMVFADKVDQLFELSNKPSIYRSDSLPISATRSESSFYPCLCFDCDIWFGVFGTTRI